MDCNHLPINGAGERNRTHVSKVVLSLQNAAMFSDAQQRRLRTTNALERVNMELKRRTRVAGLFPNEASLLRLVSALLAEYSDEWETGKTYLSMEPLT